MQISPDDLTLRELHGLLLSSVIPRPIAFASTVDEKGNNNLSPFSYFNVFSAKPPILIFSPARSGRDNSTKDTFENVLKIPEVVINIVHHDIVEQMSLSSCSFDPGVDEFIKSGLTPVASLKVKPPRVKESPISFECKVDRVEPLGKNPGAGNLVICEVVYIHINEDILIDGSYKVDPDKLKAIGRLGGNSYVKAFGEGIFEVRKPSNVGIGFDQLSKEIKESKYLTGADLARLAGVDQLPGKESVEMLRKSDLIQSLELDIKDTQSKHLLARKYIHSNDLETAWKILLL